MGGPGEGGDCFKKWSVADLARQWAKGLTNLSVAMLSDIDVRIAEIVF